MRLQFRINNHSERAFSLPEVVIAVVILGTLLVALYAGFNAGFAVMRSAREGLRATQILVQRAEVIRLYRWTELLDTNQFLKPSFVEYYDAAGVSNNTFGVKYVGTVRTNAVNISGVSYATNMRAVTMSVYWTNRIGKTNVTFNRELVTYSARYGVQNYVFGPKCKNQPHCGGQKICRRGRLWNCSLPARLAESC
jgi:prepilin-type N-terminal cleavage/methylation domain-containing protein